MLGATIQFLDYNNYPLQMDAERIRTLARIMQERHPSLVLTHWKSDPFNIDHEVASAGVMRAATIATVPGFDPCGQPKDYPQIFLFEPTVSRDDDTGFRPNYYVPIDSAF